MGRWVWLSAIAVAIGTVWYQWKDDSLLPDAQRWMQQGGAASASGSRAFAFLMGFDVPASEDPVQMGKVRISQSLSVVQNTQADDDPPARISLPTGDGFCRIRQQGCLDSILAQGASLTDLLSRHELVLSRYQQFLQFEEFNSMTPLDAEAIVPPVSFLSTGNKLMQFSVIVESRAGNRDKGSQILEYNIASLRRHLSYADTLMQKVFIGSLIADSLDLAAGLYSRGLIEPLSGLQPLVPEEITLEQAIQREFASHVQNFSHIAANGMPDSETNKPPSQFIFKKNRSINTLYKELHQLLIRSSLPAALVDDAFYAHRKKQEKNALYSLSNPVGSIVVKTVVNLEPVVFRLRDLDCKLKLLGIRMQVPPHTGVDLLTHLPDSVDISNPYEPEKLMALNSENQTMCFDGPASQRPNARCIAL